MNGAIGVVNAPELSFGRIFISGTGVIFSGFGGQANALYWVLTSTNLALPATNWTRLLTNRFDGFGDFVFTSAFSYGGPPRFYRLQRP
jgi:hypothetical protein